MKILFLTRRFYPDIGGVEKHVFELSKELIKRGHEITLITEERKKNYHSKHQSDTYDINSTRVVKSIQTNRFEFRKIKIFRLNPGKENWLKKFRIWVGILGMTRAIRGADIVHCHDVFFWYLPFRFLLPTKKVFITFHGYETKFPPTIKAKLVRKISEKLSSGNICVGEYIKRWYGTKPDYVTYGGVEKVQSSKFKVQSYNRKTKKLNILLIGRLEEDNGARIYLKALKELRNRSVAYNLFICGDGQFKKRFKKYGDVIGLTPDLNKYIDRADFIFASSYLSILEALYRSKKVFSVFQNELKEDYLKLSPFSKYISISRDASSLVENVLTVIYNKDDKTYNKVERARDWSKKQTWSKVAEIYLQLWKS